MQRLQRMVKSLSLQVQQLQGKRIPGNTVTPNPSAVTKPPTIAVVSTPEGEFHPVSLIRPSVSPLQSTLAGAAQIGEDMQGFDVYPVFEQKDSQGDKVRSHSPISFERLKELKAACVQYGPTAPFTLAIIDSMVFEALPPGDWKQVAKACLSGGDYLLWKTEYTENCQTIAEVNKDQGVPITFDMLAGEGPFRELENQLKFDVGVYAQVNAQAKKAWRKLPSNGKGTEDLSKIRQGPDELYQNFVDRLLQAANRLVGDSEAGLALVKLLAYENANSACQAALRPYRRKGNITDYISLCSDIGPSYTQGLALAAALQGKSVKEVLFQQQKGNKRKFNAPPGSCFGCGKMGHQVKQCPQKQKNDSPRKEPELCPKCKRGKHWANECKSKYDHMGNLLLQGNGGRGPLQAPQQCYGALQNFIPQQNNPFRTSAEQPQAVQDWTSVPVEY
uniref:endogenous retrovirus group K member 10 Gag polyprotein-like n=1 Tax=Jaculus jaculus TaxID=51337 RepID=UPI001E1B4373|nr:endogenous retrovirus group K member 10 Gag polyprotein-like [Jaculus jaculus]